MCCPKKSMRTKTISSQIKKMKKDRKEKNKERNIEEAHESSWDICLWPLKVQKATIGYLFFSTPEHSLSKIRAYSLSGLIVIPGEFWKVFKESMSLLNYLPDIAQQFGLNGQIGGAILKPRVSSCGSALFRLFVPS